MSNKEPVLYDFIVAVDKVESFHVRIRDNMQRGWDVIERRAIALVESGQHEPYSEARGIEFRMGGSWVASEYEQAMGAFQMLPGYCRECFKPLMSVEIEGGTTICEECERKEAKLSEPGLYAKYLVFKNDGDPMKNLVGDCFVLRPTTDDAAYEAMWQYVDSITNDPDKEALADDLRAWLRKIADDNREKRVQEASE